jgi:hypothetical protein
LQPLVRAAALRLRLSDYEWLLLLRSGFVHAYAANDRKPPILLKNSLLHLQIGKSFPDELIAPCGSIEV